MKVYGATYECRVHGLAKVETCPECGGKSQLIAFKSFNPGLTQEEITNKILVESQKMGYKATTKNLSNGKVSIVLIPIKLGEKNEEARKSK